MRGEMPLKACTTREVVREKDRPGSVKKDEMGKREGERDMQRQNDEKAASRQLTAHEATAIAGERWREREKEKEELTTCLSGTSGGEIVPLRVPSGRPYFPYLPTFSRPDVGTPSLGFSRLRSFSRSPCVWLNIALLF